MVRACEVRWERIRSRVLEGNALADPAEREVPVILPPGYAEDAERRYPVIYLLAGFLGSGRSYLNWEIFLEAMPARLGRLAAEGMQPAIIVLPDCSTRLGGSQYRNSSATGRYADHVVEEVVPHVDRTYRSLPGRRGLVGKSSGGFGALVLGMERPDLFRAVASHSGDCYFEYCYKPDFPRAVDRLVRAGGPAAFLEEFEAAPKKSPSDLQVLNVLAMAACYSPDPGEPLGTALPFHLPSGEVREEVWERWLENDPVHKAGRHAAALRDLELLHLECGARDEYNLHLGMRVLSGRLEALGVRHHAEEFDDDHRGLHYRFDVTLPRLAAVLAAGGK